MDNAEQMLASLLSEHLMRLIPISVQYRFQNVYAPSLFQH